MGANTKSLPFPSEIQFGRLLFLLSVFWEPICIFSAQDLACKLFRGLSLIMDNSPIVPVTFNSIIFFFSFRQLVYWNSLFDFGIFPGLVGMGSPWGSKVVVCPIWSQNISITFGKFRVPFFRFPLFFRYPCHSASLNPVFSAKIFPRAYGP